MLKINTDDLYTLLYKIRNEIPNDLFSGIGIVIYESLDNLPLFQLSENSKINQEMDLSLVIKESCQITNLNHDGFILINKNLEATHRNIYFAPPINSSVTFIKEKGYGTRYVAALLGSIMDGVLLTAVVSHSYGIVIFKNGEAIRKESND